MTSTIRHIEIPFPKKTLEDLIAGHLYSVSWANDNEDVEVSFHSRHLKSTGETIPLAITLSSRKEDVKDNNGA